MQLGEREESRGEAQKWWNLSPQCWGWLNTCLRMGCGEWIPCFPLLACMDFIRKLGWLFSLSNREFSSIREEKNWSNNGWCTVFPCPMNPVPWKIKGLLNTPTKSSQFPFILKNSSCPIQGPVSTSILMWACSTIWSLKYSPPSSTVQVVLLFV